ncbi:hypothetical protein PYCC9005_003189 [Savitreella phatthalungensis]
MAGDERGEYCDDVEIIMQLEELGDPKEWPRIFMGKELAWIPTFGDQRHDDHGIYGGHAIAQTVWAACQTLPSAEFDLHSTHGYFLRPGNANERIVYKVYDVRTGRNYCQRRIEALQFDKCIYTCFASFKTDMNNDAKDEDCIAHDTPRTKRAVPYHKIDQVPPCPDVDMPGVTRYRSNWQMPLDIRKEDHRTENRRQPVQKRRQIHHFRPRRPVAEKSHNFQCVILLYASDRNFLFTATNAHAATEEISFNRVASLDHSTIIHRSLAIAEDVSKDHKGDWITFETRSPQTGNKRTLVRGHMWDKRGRHVASVFQEAMANVDYLQKRRRPSLVKQVRTAASKL